MTDFEENEHLIARFKELYRPGEPMLPPKEGVELLHIITELLERGFRLTGDDEDWMPPFTPDAE